MQSRIYAKQRYLRKKALHTQNNAKKSQVLGKKLGNGGNGLFFSIESSITGVTNMEANEVCLLLLESKGEILTRR